VEWVWRATFIKEDAWKSLTNETNLQNLNETTKENEEERISRHFGYINI
jgi:hypothetical protein